MSDDPLLREHAALRKQARDRRRGVRPGPEGRLAKAMREARELCDELRAKGASEADIAKGLEQTVREAWPFTREWKYLCAQCDDTGRVMKQCPGDDTCGPRYAEGNRLVPRRVPHLPHSYGVPCWCALGTRFRPATKGQSEGDELAAVGKTKGNKGGFSRIGR